MTTTNSINLTATTGAPYITYTEEGAWTPVITGSTIAGVGTYVLQLGVYTRIGKLVTIVGDIIWTAHTGTGNMTITGLPFACRTIANYDALFSLNTINIDWPAGSDAITAFISSGASTINLVSMRDNNTNQNIMMDAAGTIQIVGSYLIT